MGSPKVLLPTLMTLLEKYAMEVSIETSMNTPSKYVDSELKKKLVHEKRQFLRGLWLAGYRNSALIKCGVEC